MVRDADNIVMHATELDGKVNWVRFRVAGVPVAQGSKRHVGRGIMVESSSQLKPWRQEIVAAIEELGLGAPLTGPVEALLDFSFVRPKNHFGTGRNAEVLKSSAPDYVASRPDADKLARAALDAMTTARLVGDDSQVAVLIVTKRYGLRPGLSAVVRTLS